MRTIRLTGRATLAAVLVTALAALGGCGQKGPLTLPDKARPIERLPTTPAPGAQPSDTAPPTEENQEERGENGR